MERDFLTSKILAFKKSAIPVQRWHTRSVILTVAHYKGGVGKSTTTIALGSSWHREGRSVAIVDADEQGTVTDWSVQADLTEGVEGENPHRPHVLSLPDGKALLKKVPELAQQFEHVLIDSPPRLGRVTRAALVVADVALIPIGPGGADAWPLRRTLVLLEEARKVNSRLQVFYLLSKFDPRTVDESSIREALLETNTFPVLKSVVSSRTPYYRALTVGSDPSAYDRTGVVEEEVRGVISEITRKHAAWRRRRA